jgi:hypothetical protein
MSLASANILIEDCEVINGAIIFNATKVNIKNLKYADVMTGTTPAINNFAISGQGADIDIDGVSPVGGLAYVHPYQAFFGVLGFYRNLSIANIGTPASPWDVGSANAMGNILNCGVGSPTMLRRIYLNNLRSNPINLTTTTNGIQLFDCWATGNEWTDVSAPNFIGRGNRFSVFKRGFSGAQGTHWNDAYDSPTTGRIQLFANEPTALSASQFSGTFGIGSGYTGTGGIIVSKITDDLVWTSPYKFYGHTAFGGGCSVAGTDTQNLIFEYKIDTGGGFGGSWTLLANTVRCSNPTSGQNQVTVNAGDLAALSRQPQIGDFIGHGTNRLPQNTTITNIAGSVITCSNNFISNPLGNFGDISFSPVNVPVSPTDGYALQIRCRATIAATTTAFAGFHAGILTDATAQKTQHPLPGFLFTMTDLKAGSEVRAYVGTDPLTCTEIAGIESSGTSFTFDHNVGGQAGYIRIISLGYIDIYLPITYQSANQSIPIQQQLDRQYSNP